MSESGTKSLTVGVDTVEGVAVVTLSGSADAAEAQTLQEALVALAVGETPVIVVDLGGVDFIGSSGLSALVVTHREARGHGGQVRLVNPKPVVREVLETTRLTEVFPIYSSVEEAIRG